MRNNLILGLLFLFGTLAFSPVLQAAEIQNLKVTPTGTQLIIDWDQLSAEIMAENQGYAITWATSSNKVRTNEIPRLFTTRNTQVLRLADFEINETYYFRIFTYNRDRQTRRYNLANPSQGLQWKLIRTNEAEFEFVTISDPVIANSTSSVSSADTTYDFGEIRITAFATTGLFTWTKARLAKSEFDGYKIVLSTNSDLSDPLHELKVSSGTTKAFADGLVPSTTYYIGGYFYENEGGAQRSFGKTTIKTFKTAPAFTSRQQSSYSRAIARLKASGLGVMFKVGNSTTTAPASTTPLTTTNLSSKTDVERKIRALEAEIRTKQSELATLKRKLAALGGSTSSRTTSTRTTSKKSTTSTKGLTLRERILLRLNRNK